VVSQKIDELTNAAQITRTAKEEVDTSILSNIGLLED
jgi:peptidyl-prolyl cis-trans isomerase C